MSTPIDATKVTELLSDEQAEEDLREYFHSGRYTGGRFERFAGGGDHPSVANHFTSDDIVAVALLSVRVPGAAALSLLESHAVEFSELLAEIPNGVDLWDADAGVVGPESAANALWSRLVDVPGLGWVSAGKLMTRKRPRLIPVYDRVVKDVLQRPSDDSWWVPLHALFTDHREVRDQLEDLRSRAEVGDDISLLRVFDVVLWMRGTSAPPGTPSADD